MAGKTGEGSRRLALLLGGLGVLACAVPMGFVLLLYGRPHNPVWWVVMAAILAAVFVGPRLLMPLFEWVAEGYRRDASAR